MSVLGSSDVAFDIPLDEAINEGVDDLAKDELHQFWKNGSRRNWTHPLGPDHPSRDSAEDGNGLVNNKIGDEADDREEEEADILCVWGGMGEEFKE